MARRKRSSNLSRRHGSGRNESGKFVTAVYVGFAIIAIGAVAMGFYWMSRTAEAMALDPDTLCPLSTGPTEETVLLFDLTDPLTPAQSGQLIQRIESTLTEAAIGTQFTMGVVSPEASSWGATPALCKPRSDKDVSALTQNLAQVQARYEERFLLPLRANIEKMIGSTGADSSPIMESLQALLADTPGFLTSDVPRTVIIVSDLLQHSEAMSFYRGENWSSFSASPDFERLSRSLQDAEVLIFRIPRSVERIQDPAIVEDFWVRYLDIQGARIPQVVMLGDL
jgi:hypothetical protein